MGATLDSSLANVQLFDRGWRYLSTVNASGILAATAISTPEQMNFLLPTSDGPYYGVEWLGKWAAWDHPTQGRFTGVIVDYHVNGDSGTIELAAYGFMWLLSKRITGRKFQPAMGPAGAIVSRLFSGTELDLGMPYNLSVDERGEQISYEFRLDSVANGIDELASATGQEWDASVDAAGTFQFTWAENVGEDASANLTITDGIDCLMADIDGTIADTVNDLAALADDDQYDNAAGARVQSLGSIVRFGRLQEARRYVGLVNQSTLGPRAQNDLKRAALPTETFTLRIPHLSQKLETIRNGTRFRFVSPSTDAIYVARVLARDVSLDDGLANLTCEVITDLTRAADYTQWRWGGIPAVEDTL